MARRRNQQRTHTAEEARYVQPPGADPGFIQDAPETVAYFWVRTEAAAGETDPTRPDGWQLHHVGAGSEKEARDVVEELERLNATAWNVTTQTFGHGGKPWKIAGVEAATRHVDPDGDSYADTAEQELIRKGLIVGA